MSQERIRGTADLGMTPEGIIQVKQSAELIKHSGGLEVIFHSDLERCNHTARIISQIAGGTLVNMANRLDPWHLGKFEGMLVDDIKSDMEYFVNHPDSVVPGRGIRGDYGESFNQFKERVLSALTQVDYRYAHYRRGVVGNYRTLALATAFVAAGCPLDFAIAKSFMFQSGIDTGEALLVSFGSEPSAKKLSGKYTPEMGFVMIRHGETPWNEKAETKKIGS